MKSKKVLFGLIVSAFMGLAGFASAQTTANYNNSLKEIGPDNIAGRVRALVVDQSDPTHKTLYAGGVAGGLYKKVGDEFMWNYVPYTKDGKQYTLPISCMAQSEDNMIYIGTGEGFATGKFAHKSFIAPEGVGLITFNPANGEFATVAGTEGWKYINNLYTITRNNNMYLYAATNEGLYRWKVAAGAALGTPDTVFSEAPVQDVEIISGDNMAFFTSGSHVYKITNVLNPATTNKYTCIDTVCAAFGSDAIRVELAAARTSSRTYLYAMVTGANGLLEGVYLTNNQQDWVKISTPTVVPFTSDNNGWHNSTICINPTNYSQIFIAGATIWLGEGFVDGATYQWNKVSYSEDELNTGNYMESVYPNGMFLHSGVHAIVPTTEISETGDTNWFYYISTDGGVYRTRSFGTFASYNKGLNTVQFNGVCVAPDGSVLGGAMDNSCPFIQARLDHNFNSNSHSWETNNNTTNNTWYDNGSTLNHISNVLWMGNGGQVEASMFQMVLPRSQRGLFFSAMGSNFTFVSDFGAQKVASYGRAYGDYSDYTNTQTWTAGDAFLENGIATGYTVPQMVLWETLNSQMHDSTKLVFDTLGSFTRGGVVYDLTDTSALRQLGVDYASQLVLLPGDVLPMYSRAHFNYPFDYTVTDSLAVASILDYDHPINVRNPIGSRLFISGKNSTGKGIVRMTISATDYSKVWTGDDAGQPSTIHWYDVLTTPGISGQKQQQTGCLAVSNDGDAVFVHVIDTNDRSYILRVHNFNAAIASDYNTYNSLLNHSGSDYPGMPRITIVDTITDANGDQLFFDRTITSMFFDRRDGQDRLLITLDGDTTTNNVYIIENASNPATRTITGAVVNGGKAVYSSLIEKTTGTIYVGTSNGVYTSTNLTSWEEYGDFRGVPVTSIRQQIAELPSKSYKIHEGINEVNYLFAKTKYPYAMYFGTYGRGIFMDMKYVTDTVNDIVADEHMVGITTVDNGDNHIAIYPNPATNYANIQLSVMKASNAVIKVYDLSGKLVYSDNLGRVEEGVSNYRLNVEGLRHGMYLINVNFGKESATSKLIVK